MEDDADCQMNPVLRTPVAFDEFESLMLSSSRTWLCKHEEAQYEVRTRVCESFASIEENKKKAY